MPGVKGGRDKGNGIPKLRNDLQSRDAARYVISTVTGW